MAINHLLNQTGHLETETGVTDRHGKPTFAAGANINIRFEQTSKIIATATKEREPIDGIVFVKPNQTVDIGDKLTYNEVEYRVMRVSPIVVGNGTVHHKELLVQRWSYPS